MPCRRKISKNATEVNIRNGLKPGFSLVSVNWKKGGKAKIMTPTGHIKFFALYEIAR